ncbi:hypothetical protein ACI0X9_003321 [Cronobacter turicensis]
MATKLALITSLLTFMVCFSSTVKSAEIQSIPMNIQQYGELGRFGVPRAMTLFVVKFNGKTFVLSGMPDRRLYGLSLGVSKDGREIICGQVSSGLKMPVCYYVLFREK